MIILEKIHLVQFSFFDADTVESRGDLTVLGQNGAGKTSILDAIQIAMLGGHGNYLSFNSQSVSKQQKRSIRDYCLGEMQPQNNSENNVKITRKRDYAQSYITLVFRNEKTNTPLSVGIAIQASVNDAGHKVKGIYILNDVELKLEDHTQEIEEGLAPKEWKTFEAEILRLGHKAGREPFVTTHPQEYIENLIPALQSSAKHINVNAFVRAFKKSMDLQGIENVDGFVRDYLIEYQKIDKQNSRLQIARMQELFNLVKDTEEQIQKLGDIEKQMNSLEEASKKRDSLKAVKLTLQMESIDREVDVLLDTQTEKETEMQDVDPAIQMAEINERKFKDLTLDLTSKISADPTAADKGKAKELLQAQNGRLSSLKRQLESYLHSLRNLSEQFTSAVSHINTNEINKLKKQNEQIFFIHSQGNLLNIEQVESSYKLIKSCLQAFEFEMSKANERLAENELQYKSKMGALAAQSKGSSFVSDRVGAAIQKLSEAGIEAVPVASLLKIKDSEWQGAIESFLGVNRETLYVDPSQVKEAIEILKGAKDRWAIGVGVINPTHLKDNKYNESNLTADLIFSDNLIAKRYIDQLLAGMVCVNTAEELKASKRAITKDGMISANGKVSKTELTPADRWQIGTRTSPEVISKLELDIGYFASKLTEDKNIKQKFDSASRSLYIFLDVGTAEYAEAYNEYITVIDQIKNIPDPESVGDSDYIKGLRTSLEEAKLQEKEAAESKSKLIQSKGRLGSEINSLKQSIIACSGRRDALSKELDEAKTLQFYDSRVYANLHQDIVDMDENIQIAECDAQQKRFDSAASRLEVEVVNAFRNYIDKNNISLEEERQDWLKAKGWIGSELQKLISIKLVEYKQEAEEAAIAAEASFRTDVALKIREELFRLEKSIREINSTLDKCPVFSNGVKYRFEAKPAEEHKDILEYIKNITKIEDGSLFNQNDYEVKDKIANALKNPSPLCPIEDYRLFYKFDLLILEEGRVVSSLSERIGVASNGEHRVPFYVIAGAALASAYRISADKKHEGAAIMLLDEAFHGMDNQNSYATAEFLTGLGLQLIMAAPDDRKQTMSALSDTVCMLERINVDAFLEHEHIKPAMHKIMTSDMPSIHPVLIEDMIDKLNKDKEAIA